MSRNQAKIIIKAEDDTKGAFASLKQSLQQTSQQAESIKRGFNKLGDIVALEGIVTVLKNVAGGFNRIVMEAAELDGASEEVKRYKDSIGSVEQAFNNVALQAVPAVNQALEMFNQVLIKIQNSGFVDYVGKAAGGITNLGVKAVEKTGGGLATLIKGTYEYGKAAIDAATSDKTLSETLGTAKQNMQDFGAALDEVSKDDFYIYQENAKKAAERTKELANATTQALRDIEKAEKAEIKALTDRLQKQADEEVRAVQKRQEEERRLRAELHDRGMEALKQATSEAIANKNNLQLLERREQLERMMANAIGEDAQEYKRLYKEVENSLEANWKEIQQGGTQAFNSIGEVSESAAQKAIAAFKASNQVFTNFVAEQQRKTSERIQSHLAELDRIAELSGAFQAGERRLRQVGTGLPEGVTLRRVVLPVTPTASALGGARVRLIATDEGTGRQVTSDIISETATSALTEMRAVALLLGQLGGNLQKAYLGGGNLRDLFRGQQPTGRFSAADIATGNINIINNSGLPMRARARRNANPARGIDVILDEINNQSPVGQQFQ